MRLPRISNEVMRLVGYYHGVEGHRLAAAVKRLKAAPKGREDSPGSALSVLAEIDALLQGHGVEYVETTNARWGAYYVNMGDTYSPTVMIQTRPRRSILVGRDWGSYVERYDP